MYVYQLSHVNPKNKDEKPIGVYLSLTEVKEVIEKYKKFKGFKEAPDHFYIDKYELNKMYWAEGYYSVKIESKEG